MATPVGLAHVAAVSFLAARLAPSGAFWLALAGGAAVARESDLRGLRAGYAGSAAAMLQTVAILGPLRLSAPLTQALSAPLLGSMHSRGRRSLSMFAVCVAIRLALYAALTAFTVFVLLGPAGYTGSFDALLGWLPGLPDGLAGALLLTGIVNFVAAVFFSAIQVALYRRALGAWPEPASSEPRKKRRAAVVGRARGRRSTDHRRRRDRGDGGAAVHAQLDGACAPSRCGSRARPCWHDTATVT